MRRMMWHARALRALRSFAANHILFRIEDARLWAYSNGLPEPDDASIWNAVSREAINEGTITKVGVARAEHQTLKLVNVYRSRVAHEGAATCVTDAALDVDRAGRRLVVQYEHPATGWRGTALDAVRDYCLNHDAFTVEELRRHVEGTRVRPPADKRAWGAVITNARALGWIVAHGVETTAGGKNNSTRWESRIRIQPPQRRALTR